VHQQPRPARTQRHAQRQDRMRSERAPQTALPGSRNAPPAPASASAVPLIKEIRE